MIESLFLKYDLTKTALSKGFDFPCIGFFAQNRKTGKVSLNIGHCYSEIDEANFEYISAPLWQQIVEWINVKHGLHLTVNYLIDPSEGDSISWVYCIETIYGVGKEFTEVEPYNNKFRIVSQKSYPDCKEAWEAGIEHALNLIQ